MGTRHIGEEKIMGEEEYKVRINEEKGKLSKNE